MTQPAIDVHTHVYPSRYVGLLRNRTAVPRIVTRDGQDRMLILPHEDTDNSTAAGRPIGSEYWDPARKLAYMDRHGIAVSVLSPANPWLDFLLDAAGEAAAINRDMEALCATGGGRFYGLGLLPVRDQAAAAAEIRHIATLPHLRGVIIGTTGAGKGLDDPALDPVWAAAEAEGLMVFIHPHYGLGTEALAGFGHATLLALGFPFETTAAVTRLILSGVLDRFPHLRLLIAHAGGVLPYLAARLDACVAGDAHSPVRLQARPSTYLKRMYYDAIGYQGPTLSLLMELAGGDRLMFGTDHPFFPPHVRNDELDSTEWHSAAEHRAVLAGFDADTQAAILSGNALSALRISLP